MAYIGNNSLLKKKEYKKKLARSFSTIGLNIHAYYHQHCLPTWKHYYNSLQEPYPYIWSQQFICYMSTWPSPVQRKEAHDNPAACSACCNDLPRPQCNASSEHDMYTSPDASWNILYLDQTSGPAACSTHEKKREHNTSVWQQIHVSMDLKAWTQWTIFAYIADATTTCRTPIAWQ